ncbi:hypothetical protein E1B28_013307 [Marasmius oreades]|uniref:Uncharacterized protein n=1 Tax=Marasmius oreades TaxID=181124 RepID=A0A9P7ULY1_9AGAR|nr:uncharacterized protein E1B28_013307 [Marasmius oreades]KAG7087332.1 hypothetical protein E1B28_013307 [Marasmius oreades]
MSYCSTTATSTYTLQKYSRSYPNPSQSASNEWQHFTNPLIRLILDVQKSASDKLESVRLRIIWSIEGGTGPNSTNEVVFEDLDLLSFSSIPLRNRSERTQQPEGLPLKAVYRDTIVGIRYLHPLDGSTYRRFQVTFSSSSAVSQFIQSIEAICPCKANNNPTTMPSIAQSQAQSSFVASKPPASQAPILPESSLQIPNRAQTMLRSKPSFFIPPNIPQSSSGLPAFLPPFHPTYQPNFLRSHLPTGAHLLPEQLSLQSRLSMPRAVPMFAPHWSSLPPSSNPSSTPPSESSSSPNLGSNPSQACANPPPGSGTPSEMASSQTLGSTPSQSNMPPPLPPPSMEPLLASLREGTRLYDLPPHKLEALVAEVIREDGFVGLMENISTMWRLKGYLGQ